MRTVSVGRMALALREEYTSVAIKRSANIDNCAPDGYFNLIHAVALAAFSGDPVPVSTVREKYNSGIKNSKDIMTNCAMLTYQPFPIIESTKKRSLNSDEVINSPLYDEATGNSVQEKYSNVVLSDLGRLLTRHYRDMNLSSIENYNSIVPFSLLRKNVPWSMGHRAEMYPLNPSELFKIIDKMLEINSPFVPEDFLLETFKGVDVGENYNVYINTKSLIKLYTKGEASLTIMPDIDIRRNENKIIIKRPPIDSTTKKLISHLRAKSLDSELNKYTYFDLSTKVDMVGNEAHINVTKWRGTNRQIMEDFLLDNKIAIKKYIKNETLVFLDKPENRSNIEEDSILGKPVQTVKLSELADKLGGLSEDELKNFNMSDFATMIDKYNVLEDEENEDKVVEEEMSDDELNKRVLTPDQEMKIIRNPYNFELDLMPIYEVLWRCILGERKLLQLGYIKRLREEKEKLQYDLLLEKATRPEVAKLIYKLQPKDTRERELLEQTKEGSELLPEGFLQWEVEEIYKDRGNNILPNIFKRDKFKDLYLRTQERIKNLEKRINNPELLNNQIRTDIKPFITGEKYQRKTKVWFIPDFGEEFTEKTKKRKVKEKISITSRQDSLDLPCTIFFDRQKIRRNYGVNMYFSDFDPLFELNTTNFSDIQVFFSEQGSDEVKSIMCKARDIAVDKTTVFGESVAKPARLLGVIPVEKDVEFIMWTSHARFLVYTYKPVSTFGLRPDEYILGWEYYDKQFLDIRGSNGIQTVEKTEFPKFKIGLKDLYEPMGMVYDMFNKAHSDKVFRLRNRVTNRDYKKQRRTMWKTKAAMPIPISDEYYDYVFSPHRTKYFGGVYIPSWQLFGRSKHEKYLPPKKVKLTEYAWTDDKTSITKTIYSNVYRKMHYQRPEALTPEEAEEYKELNLIARFTNSYLDFDLEAFDKFGVIDERALNLYKEEQRERRLVNETRKEYEDRLEKEKLDWSNSSDEDDIEDTTLDEDIKPDDID